MRWILESPWPVKYYGTTEAGSVFSTRRPVFSSIEAIFYWGFLGGNANFLSNRSEEDIHFELCLPESAKKILYQDSANSLTETPYRYLCYGMLSIQLKSDKDIP
jgi:hypothetical protein